MMQSIAIGRSDKKKTKRETTTTLENDQPANEHAVSFSHPDFFKMTIQTIVAMI
jgi:hypothetical protein